MFLFLSTLFAELIANDKPLFVSFKGGWYFPVFVSYPETAFGGEFETETNYRDPYVKDLIAADGWSLWPLIPYSYDTVNYDLKLPAPAPPGGGNVIGTDDQGRDLLARLIYGFRYSVLFALILTLISATIGIMAGAIQGYFGGKMDLIFQRFMEIWHGLPTLFILIILSTLVEPNFWWLLGFMSLFKWMIIVPAMRAEFLRARTLDYVTAARAMGASAFSVMTRHILPNVLSVPITTLPFMMTSAITSLATLDFLGFGLPPGSPSLGEILNQGKNNLFAPWIGIGSFTTLALTLTLLVFMGEGIRDAFDPKKNIQELS